MGLLRKLDDWIYQAERQIVAWSMIVMGLVVFLDVVYHNATRDDGFMLKQLARFLSPETAATAAPWVSGVLALVFFYAVYRARGVKNVGAAWAFSAVSVAALVGLVKLYVHLCPNGLIWSQRLGLVLMTLAGFVGASMAAKERRHLALEVGPKLFPEALRKYVIALGHLVTAGFAIWLASLAVWSLMDHHQDWEESGRNGSMFAELPIPFWIAFMPIAYSLGMMGLRFLGDAFLAAKGVETSEDEVATFKRLGGVDDEPGKEGSP